MKKIRGIIGSLIVAMMIITVGCGESSQGMREQMLEVKSEDILNDYIRDVGTAQQKYKDKKIKITGRVVNTGQYRNSTNFFVTTEYKYIGGKRYEVLLNYPVDRVNEINQLKIGDFIVAEGHFQGVVAQEEPTTISVQLAVSESNDTKKSTKTVVEKQTVVVQPSTSVQMVNSQGEIRGTDVRMRSGPSTNTAILGYFMNGESVTIHEVQEGWYKVVRNNGQTGWVSTGFCIKVN